MTAHLWQSTVFACAAALLTLAFRNNRVQVRFALWFAASLKFLFPFALLISLGARMGWPPVPHAVATPAVSYVVERMAQPFSSPLPTHLPHTDRTPIVLTAIWACGFLGIAAMRLRGWLRIRAAMRESTEFSMAGRAEIRAAAGLIEPGAVGIRHPVILLPLGISETLTTEQFGSVIAHELCHIQRRDNLFAALHMLVEALFWFHPLVWWIGARLIEERERACDEAVLTLGNQPRIYADAIVGVCKLYVESPLACVAGVTGADLKRRIEAIMTNRIGISLNRAKKLLLVGAAASAIAFPIAVGLVLAVGHLANLPVIHAQPPAPAPIPQVATPRPATPKPTTLQPAPQQHRMVVMMFDFASMTPNQQTRARQNAVDYVNGSLKPSDVVAVIAADNARVSIVQDFTADPVVLAAAILRLPAGSAGLPAIQSLANLLAVMPDKKSLMFYSAAATNPADPQLQGAIDAAKNANMAIFPIVVPALIAAAKPAEQNAAPTDPAMRRIYLRYGAANTVDTTGDKQIWRYNFLETFHDKAEFEFTPSNGHYSFRINYPSPTGTFASFPDHLASIGTYPAEASQILTIPLASFSGPVDIAGVIRSVVGEKQATAAAFRDVIQATSAPYVANFILKAGSYLCSLSIADSATGKKSEETIRFEVR